MGNVNILEKRMIKYEVSVKQTAKFIMMLLILSLAYVMPAATTKQCFLMPDMGQMIQVRLE